MSLTAVSHQKAINFLKYKARPLEAALYAHEFEEASADEALAALAAFQNEDGGFGHALEPDVQTAVSSVYATTVALQTLRQLGADSSQPLVQGAMRFLVAQFDAEQKRWPMLPPEAEESPRAPWWNEVGLGKGFGGFLINPRAEVVGYLWEHQSLVPTDLKTVVLQQFVYDAKAQIVTDPAGWQGYGLQPLDIITSPQSPLYAEMQEAVDANLTFMVGQQQADGAWHPAWSWGEQFAETWPKAKQAWSGFLTLNKLRVLRYFGKLP